MKNQKKSSPLEVVCTFLILGVLFTGLFLFISNRRKQKFQSIKQESGITQGIVTSIKVYKGRSITVRYKVSGNIYEESDGLDAQDNVNKWDSVTIKYSIAKPELMITEFNEEFYK
ncbi:hypothetical protein AHMF7605_00570 [Adhaeribacter arboris]|uniref:DUF3592 domain-containing protein n=1 Tax=Adhaeribacter arboris TaxID=2072846 RepID=A0A2T2Y9B6_9BACT|nr:hypothetical protein [Adhaeribacter arboris]PSR52119.1 hypothetical protein AHMF7605_00570 [Adhaeribacter arboris]